MLLLQFKYLFDQKALDLVLTFHFLKRPQKTLQKQKMEQKNLLLLLEHLLKLSVGNI